MSGSQNAGSTFGLSSGVDASIFGTNQLPDVLGLVRERLQQAASNSDLFAQVFGDKTNSHVFVLDPVPLGFSRSKLLPKQGGESSFQRSSCFDPTLKRCAQIGISTPQNPTLLASPDSLICSLLTPQDFFFVTITIKFLVLVR